MDYDSTTVPERYAVARSMSPTTLNQWLNAIADSLVPESPSDILDLGCGTGRFTRGLRERFSAHVTGIDPSIRMLSQAMRAQGIHYVQACAEALPLSSATVDLILLSMVWHHLRDRNAAATEMCRVLKRGGHLTIRTSTRETLDSCLYLKFFPEALRINEDMLPSRDALLGWANRHSLVLLRHECLVQELDSSPASYCERIQKRGMSDLATLTDAEFAYGLAALRNHCQTLSPSQPVRSSLDLFVFRL